jgi:hypothetical protein
MIHSVKCFYSRSYRTKDNGKTAGSLRRLFQNLVLDVFPVAMPKMSVLMSALM